MNKFKLKLKALWLLLTSKGYVVIYVKNPDEEEIDAGFLFSGLDAKEIILFCDSLAEDMENMLIEEEDQLMSERIGQGMINYINLN